jgi:hypothetical protein
MDNKLHLDWRAPILPLKSILGIPFGTPMEELIHILVENSMGEGELDEVCFANSPRLRIEKSERSLTFRARAIKKVYDYQDVVMKLGFTDGLFSFCRIDDCGDYSYQGKILDHVALGDQIKQLLPYCQTAEYDDVEEWFHFTGTLDGIRVGGNACSLDDDPEQRIWVICASAHPSGG